MADTTVRPGKINFRQIGQLIDPSIYEATFEGYKFEKDAMDRDRWTLIFKIVNDEKWGNKKVYRNFFPEGDAAYYFMEALVALGIDPDELMAEDEVDVEPLVKSALGAHVRLKIDIRSYKDKKTGEDKETNNVEIEAI